MADFRYALTQPAVLSLLALSDAPIAHLGSAFDRIVEDPLAASAVAYLDHEGRLFQVTRVADCEVTYCVEHSRELVWMVEVRPIRFRDESCFSRRCAASSYAAVMSSPLVCSHPQRILHDETMEQSRAERIEDGAVGGGGRHKQTEGRASARRVPPKGGINRADLHANPVNKGGSLRSGALALLREVLKKIVGEAATAHHQRGGCEPKPPAGHTGAHHEWGERGGDFDAGGITEISLLARQT